MRYCLFSLPFAAPAATFAFMYLNMGEQMSESGGTPLNPDDKESIISTFFWGLFIACRRTIPII